MKVSRAQAAENRERILDVAAQVFRERGFEGISVTDLMKEAGLTHGGFYGHFSSKEDLMAQACGRALQQSADRWRQMVLSQPIPAEGENHRRAAVLRQIAEDYLSPKHRDQPGSGCATAALAIDATRQGEQVRHTLTEGIRRHVDSFTALMPAEQPDERRQQALATYAGLVGALVLARAVDDPELSDEFLAAMISEVVKR